MERSKEIQVQIGVLQVEGVAHADAGRFRRAVERELGRLVREQGLAANGGPRAFVGVEFDTASGDHALGSDAHARAVAGAIYRGLGQ